MAQVSLVASTVLMGALVVAVMALVARSRSRHPSMLARSTAGGRFVSTGGAPLGDRVANSTLAWVVSFLLVTFGVMGAVMVLVTGGEGVWTDPRLFGAAGAAVVGIVLGTYVVSRNAGLKNSWATMVTSLVVGVFLLIALTAYLIAY